MTKFRKAKNHQQQWESSDKIMLDLVKFLNKEYPNMEFIGSPGDSTIIVKTEEDLNEKKTVV